MPVIHDCAHSIKQENEGKVFANPVQLPTLAFTWSFFPPTEKWQEEVCTTNKLDYICKIDYAGRESTLNQFTSPSLSHILDVMGDGNCLFRAISAVMTGAEKSHPIIRKQICDHMLQTNYIVNGVVYLFTSSNVPRCHIRECRFCNEIPDRDTRRDEMSHAMTSLSNISPSSKQFKHTTATS